MQKMTDQNSPEKSPWGWKAVLVAVVLSALFLLIFYAAVSSEPDYMPSQQKKTAPVTAEQHHMTEQEHAAMSEHEHDATAHSHGTEATASDATAEHEHSVSDRH